METCKTRVHETLSDLVLCDNLMTPESPVTSPSAGSGNLQKSPNSWPPSAWLPSAEDGYTDTLSSTSPTSERSFKFPRRSPSSAEELHTRWQAKLGAALDEEKCATGRALLGPAVSLGPIETTLHLRRLQPHEIVRLKPRLRVLVLQYQKKAAQLPLDELLPRNLPRAALRGCTAVSGRPAAPRRSRLSGTAMTA